MGLSIKNEEAEALVRELARRRGVGVTTAIKLAVTNELSKDAPAKKHADKGREAVSMLQKQWASIPDGIPAAEIDAWLYDENGLPH